MIATYLALTVAMPPGVEHHKTADGAEVVAVRRPGSPLVHFRVGIRAGALHDPAGKAGLARVAGITLLRSLEARVPGGRLAVETGPSATIISGRTTAARLSSTLSSVLSRMAWADTSEQHIEDAVTATRQSRLRILVDDRALLRAAGQHVIFGRHPQGRSPNGRVAELEQITRKDVKQWFEDHVQASSVVIGICGRSISAAVPEVIALASGLPRGSPAMLSLAPARARPGRHISVFDRASRRQALAMLAQPGVDVRDQRLDALMVAAAAINGSASGPVARRLEGTPGRALPSRSGPGRSLLPGIHSVAVAAPQDEIHVVLGKALAELERLSAEGLSAADAELGRQRAAGEATIRQSSASGRLDILVEARLLGRPLDEPLERAARIRSARGEEINGALRSFLSPVDLQIVVVANATSKLSAALAALPGVESVEVISVRSLP